MDDSDSLKNLYATPEDRIDTILDRRNARFWTALRKAMHSLEENITDPEAILEYVREEFGVELELSEGSLGLGFKPTAKVVDEQKYLIFILRHQS